jgi:hypothetical protein
MPYLETRLRHLRSAARQQDGEYQNQYPTVALKPPPDSKLRTTDTGHETCQRHCDRPGSRGACHSEHLSSPLVRLSSPTQVNIILTLYAGLQCVTVVFLVLSVNRSATRSTNMTITIEMSSSMRKFSASKMMEGIHGNAHRGYGIKPEIVIHIKWRKLSMTRGEFVGL